MLPAILGMCAALGARRGEVLALRWSDIAGDCVRIGRSLTQTKKLLKFKETKTGTVRYISVPRSALKILAARREQQAALKEQFGPAYQSDEDLIFAEPNGSPLKPDSISSAVSQLFRRLKLPKGASLHTLRHTHGSHLLAAGRGLTAVSKRLGHSSVRVTAEIYAHAIPGEEHEDARAWDTYQEANRPTRKAN